jgi:hypothetical protein
LNEANLQYVRSTKESLVQGQFVARPNVAQLNVAGPNVAVFNVARLNVAA